MARLGEKLRFRGDRQLREIFDVFYIAGFDADRIQ